MIETYVDAASKGTMEMLSTMMGVETNTGADVPPDFEKEIFISGLITFKSDQACGSLGIRFGKETAQNLVGLMLGMGPDEVDSETMYDGVGEMANIVAGQIKVILQNTDTNFTISLPSIIHGYDHSIEAFHSIEKKCVLLNSSNGPVLVSIQLSK